MFSLTNPVYADWLSGRQILEYDEDNHNREVGRHNQYDGGTRRFIFFPKIKVR